MDVVGIIALSMGVAWASGINLYAAVFVLGWLGSTGSLVLPEGLQICTDPLVMSAAAAMYFIEFFADKIPGIDTLWDSIHTFIRIPAGAILAAGAAGDLGQGAELAALLIGGTLSSASHATKSSRVLAERRLEAEEKKYQAGMTSSFFVLQAQRDLNVARNNELLALVEYAKSVVNYSAVQQTPLF